MNYQTFEQFRTARPHTVSFNTFAEMVRETAKAFETNEDTALEMLANWYDRGHEYRINDPQSLANFAASHARGCVVMVLAGRAASVNA